MSSEGSQRGSSVGDAGSLSFENPPADVRMLCRHESTYSQSHRLQRTEDARGHLYTRAAAPQGESHVFFERVGVSPHYSTTTSVREGASDGELTGEFISAARCCYSEGESGQERDVLGGQHRN